MSSPATPIEKEAQRVIPIEQVKGPFVYRASNNGTPAEGPYGYVLDWTEVHLGLYRHLALHEEGQDDSSHELDHHALLKMARDIQGNLSDAFPSDEVYETDPVERESRFDKDDAQAMSFLAEQLRYFEWETSQWALFQPYRQNHLEKGISREELCRAYYRWLIDSLERHDELVRSEPLRINKILQRRLVLNLRDMYPELLSDERNPPPLDTTSQAPTHTPAQPPSSPALAPKAPAAPAPQPPADAPQPPAAAPQPLATPAARSTPDRGKNQNNVNSLHRAIANPIPESLPEPEIQQPTRPAKRKRAPCALTRELRSLIQLGGPGNALVGRAVVIEPDNADQQEPQENGPDVAG